MRFIAHQFEILEHKVIDLGSLGVDLQGRRWEMIPAQRLVDLLQVTQSHIDAHKICAYDMVSYLQAGNVMRIADASKPTRKPTNVSLDSALLEEARALGINVSRSAEAGIAEAVRLSKQEQWLKNNAKAIESSNTYVEDNGLPLAKHRRF